MAAQSDAPAVSKPPDATPALSRQPEATAAPASQENRAKDQGRGHGKHDHPGGN
jgi:hypothetical protein